MKRVINLSPINYWTEQPFIDRALASHNSGQSTTMPWIYGTVLMPMDSPGATFVLTWDGGGTLQIQSTVTIVSSAVGKTVFTWPADTTATMLQLSMRNPGQTNVRVIRQDQLDAYNAGEIFRPEFLADIAGFTAFRCMDWMQTNGSTRTDLIINGLAPVPDASGGRGTSPLELIVALANKTEMRPWINFPFHITDAAAGAAYAYLDAHCSAKPIIEYSNELWNWGFQQTKDAAAAAPPTHPNDNNYYYGLRAGQLAKLARGSKVGFVLTGQLVAAFRMSGNIFTGVVDSGAVDSDFEAIAPATYITGDLTNYGKFPTLATGLQAANDTDGAHDNMMAALPTWQGYYATWATMAKAHGLKLWAYEGNFHLNAIGLSSTATTDQLNALAAFYKAVQASPRAPVTYAAYAAAFAAAGADMDAVFNFGSPPSISGNFGIKFFPATFAWIKADMAPPAAPAPTPAPPATTPPPASTPTASPPPPTPPPPPTIDDVLALANQLVADLTAMKASLA